MSAVGSPSEKTAARLVAMVERPTPPFTWMMPIICVIGLLTS
jgi:hypothetical protein